MNWEDLHTVGAVARHGGYQGAGAELGVDPTTVARRVARLEQALGLRVFDLTDGVRQPTGAGRDLLRRLAAMEQEAAAIRSMAMAETGIAGRVRLTCTPSIAERVLAPGLGALLSDHPGLRLELGVGDANANLTRWESDLAIRLARPQRGRFLARRLASLRLWLIRPASLGDSGLGEPGLVCAYPEELSDAPEMRALAAAGLDQGARLVTSQLAVITRVIASGAAVGVLPEPAARPFLEDDRFEAVALAERREVWLLSQIALRDDPAVRTVVAWIDGCFREAGLAGAAP